MADYSWLDFDLLEHREYAYTELEELDSVAQKYRKLISEYDKLKVYIEWLERQVDILQKTLVSIGEVKKKRRVRCKWLKGECSQKR